MKPVGGILAGGRARRMKGIDKPLAQLGGRPLIAHVIARLSPQADPVLINANGPGDRFAQFGLAVLPDRIGGFKGPLAGLHALMTAAQDRGARHLLAVPADTPFLPANLGDRLAGGSEDPDAVRLARCGGRSHPVAALWPVNLAAALGDYLGRTADLSLAAYLRSIGHVEVDFAADGGSDPFFNINAPDDLEQAEAMLAARKAGA
ncbi:MAG: molybdenum cofactor guanylyltransferase MobA [Roseitalea porphyridii]|uniref:molybdenum cofactor guanylyltransferase MobA n=1 Tax=Roseitalea porphyridii TaxID=1852022 RepID=UPI0032EBE802